jgi:hypothetical protein
VPFSDAVASRLPWLFMAMYPNVDWCASITLMDSSLFASYIRTSPVDGGRLFAVGGAWDG